MRWGAKTAGEVLGSREGFRSGRGEPLHTTLTIFASSPTQLDKHALPFPTPHLECRIPEAAGRRVMHRDPGVAAQSPSRGAIKADASAADPPADQPLALGLQLVQELVEGAVVKRGRGKRK